MNATLSLPARARGRRSSWRVVGIVLIYGAGFFGALPAVLWALGAGFDRGFALAMLPPGARAAGAALLVTGAALLAASMGSLVRRGRGLPISHLPPRRMVARGVYAVFRHPIYVGYALATAGAGLVARSLGHGVLAPLVLWIATLIYACGFEEPRLRARFGEAYVAYARATPLIPLPLAATLSALGHRAWLAVRPAIERFGGRTVLFRAGDGVWVTYGALVALGGMTGAVVAAPLLAGLGFSAARVALYELGLAVSMLVGGRVAWLAYEWPRSWREPRGVFRRVGFVSFGGYAGLLLFTYLFARASLLSPLVLFDRALPPAFLISAWGRLGCLSYGCCYGRPCEHGFSWRDPAAKVNRERGARGPVPRVPTPLLSAALAACVAGLGFALLGRGALPGAVTGTLLLAYALLRFGIEHWRDEARVTPLLLTKGQLLAAPLFAAGLALLVGLPRGGGALLHPRLDISVLPELAPVFVAVLLLAFLVCGYHRREVGRW